MAHVVDAIGGKVRALFVERRRAARERATCEVRLQLGVSLPHEQFDPEAEEFPHPIMGHTRDVSATGLSFVLPSTRLGSQDISRAGAELRVVLCLPTGVIIVRAETVHCQPLPAEEDEQGGEDAPRFLLGARITKMFETDRRAYDTFLRGLAPRASADAAS